MAEQLPPQLFDRLFDDRRTRKEIQLVWSAIKYSASFVGLFLLFFMILNFPAYLAKATYLINPPVVTPTKTVLEPQPVTPPTTLPTPTLVSQEQNNRLTVPKINIEVPVIWDVAFEEIIPKLADGVVHYGGTALPGQNGNVFITGHSSNFWWDKGKFNTIFANLDQLEIGDEIVATYNNVKYRYIVEKKFVVDPARIEVLNPSDHSIISLMTCTPVGTTINRLIVQAKQVEPTPIESADKPSPPPLPDKLPAVR